MKILTYIIAVVVLAAATWFSYDTKVKFTNLQSERLELASSNDKREDFISEKKSEAIAMEAERDAANVALSDAKGDLEEGEDNMSLTKREVDAWDEKIATQTEKIEAVETLITSIKKEFDGLDVDIADVPSFIAKLEEDVKTANMKVEELASLTESAEKRVASSTEELSGLRARVAKRAERIKGNSSEGLITAVDHDWGIAVVNVPTSMPVDSSSKLMVRRGSSYIGKLKITSIEGSRVIADLDYLTMSSGNVAQAGDTVVLTKPVTN